MGNRPVPNCRFIDTTPLKERASCSCNRPESAEAYLGLRTCLADIGYNCPHQEPADKAPVASTTDNRAADNKEAVIAGYARRMTQLVSEVALLRGRLADTQVELGKARKQLASTVDIAQDLHGKLNNVLMSWKVLQQSMIGAGLGDMTRAMEHDVRAAEEALKGGVAVEQTR